MFEQMYVIYLIFHKNYFLGGVKMGFVNGLVLIVLGALCIPALVAQKSPKAKELLDKVVPYQAIVGFVAFIWGIWVIIQCVLGLGWIGWNFPFGLIRWITYLVNGVILLCGGAILGWGLIQKKLLAKAPDNVKAKAEESFAKLVAFQPKIGIASIIFGVWVIVSAIII
ncbi:MAG: hypothetical protein LBU89_04395 [Fibromonadaceae bacterium]|jgi:hypothetical protein|nr:hypothetical protein [Fibromonadaceae bacterium]